MNRLTAERITIYMDPDSDHYEVEFSQTNLNKTVKVLADIIDLLVNPNREDNTLKYFDEDGEEVKKP